MIDINALQEFVEPYYLDKDIMHNMWHIELVKRKMENIVLLAGIKMKLQKNSNDSLGIPKK